MKMKDSKQVRQYIIIREMLGKEKQRSDRDTQLYTQIYVVMQQNF